MKEQFRINRLKENVKKTKLGGPTFSIKFLKAPLSFCLISRSACSASISSCMRHVSG